MARGPVRFRGLKEYRDNRGRLRRYHRATGTALPSDCSLTDERFLRAWLAVTGQKVRPQDVRRPGCFADVLEAYRASHDWRRLADGTRESRAAIMTRMDRTFGHLPARGMTAQIVEDMLRPLAPHAANNWLKVLRAAFAAAVSAGVVAASPLVAVKKRRTTRTDGHKVWTAAMVEAFRARWPVGTQERLALELLFWTVQSRDVIYMGRESIEAGQIVSRRSKTGQEAVCGIGPELAAALAPWREAERFLVNSKGKPHPSRDAFGMWFDAACEAAQIPAGHRAHGLRKAGLTFRAEQGWTEAELMALAGHLSATEAARYVSSANRRRLASSGQAKLSSGRAMLDKPAENP